MKTILVTLLVITTINCRAQNNKYNDWFDMNLKGKPKSVKEISIFSLNSFVDSELKTYLISTVKEMLFIDEFQFDSLGLISNEYHKNILDTIGYWYDSKNRKVINYKDSLIRIGFFSNGQESWREKWFLDSNEYVISKIGGLYNKDSTIIERDNIHRISRIYSHLYSADFHFIIKTENTYNDNDDVISQIRFDKRFFVSFEKPKEEESLTDFFYIYDSRNNWIIKVRVNNNKISLITQRAIEY